MKGLDRIIAYAGLSSSIALIVYVLAVAYEPLYILSLSAFAVVSLIWIWRPNRPRTSTHFSLPSSSFKLLLILYLAMFMSAVVTHHLRLADYSRPLVFFVIVSGMDAILVAEALATPRRIRTKLILSQAVATGCLVMISANALFPSVLGVDPAWHMSFTDEMLSTGQIPDGTGYSEFPLYHILTSTGIAVVDIDFKASSMLLVSICQNIILIAAVFLIANHLLGNSRAALISSILISSADRFVQFSWWSTPNTLASIYFFLILMLGVKLATSNSSSKTPTTLVILVLSTSLVVSHSLTTVAALVALTVFWLIKKIKPRELPRDRSVLRTIVGTLSLFYVLTISWWISSRTPWITISDLVELRFGSEVFNRVPAVTEYYSSIPLQEHVLASLGFILFVSISLYGCLHLMSLRSTTSIAYSFICILFLTLGFLSLVGDLGILQSRWLYFSEILLAVPLGLAFLDVLTAESRKLLRFSFILVLTASISLLMLLSPVCNNDNHQLSEHSGIRYAFTTSEIEGAIFLTSVSGGFVSSDFDFATNPSSSVFVNYCEFPKERIVSMDYFFLDPETTAPGGLIVIRDEITEHPFRVNGGIFRIEYDLLESLSASGVSNVVFDNGEVVALI